MNDDRIPPVKLPPLSTRVSRGLRLRCPLCGGGEMLETWFRMRPRCPRCGLGTDRTQGDLFLGGMMFNLVASEGVMAALLVGVAIATWPDVPWNTIWFGGLALMIAAPFAFLPFSRTLWLAFDLMLHPPTPDQLTDPGAVG
jgi:uncharacterized protein (DUF983 family)